MGFAFAELEALRLRCKEVLEDQETSLAIFSVRNGFRNKYDSTKTTISISSTITCVLSLVATSSWQGFKSSAQTKRLLKELISRKTSADLPKDNPFTTAWILEAVTALQKYSDPLDDEDKAEIARKEDCLLGAVDRGDGGITMEPFPYPPSGYLTQLVTRVLKSRDKLSPKRSEKIN
jgi:hypothetical protein